MTDGGAGRLRVVPSEITNAGAEALSIATGVGGYAAGLPGIASASWVGDGRCADALVTAGRLLEQMVSTTAADLVSLSKALDVAGVTYRVADAEAVPASAGALP